VIARSVNPSHEESTMDKSENCVDQDPSGVDLDAWLAENGAAGTTLGELIKKALADGTKGALMEMPLADLAAALSRASVE
jgi:hypothetical protein